MILIKRRTYDFHSQVLSAVVLSMLVMGATMSAAQSKKNSLPRVVNASVPFYPRLAQQAHILGIVRLRVSTDGKRASSVEILSGPPLLAQVAKTNVETWEFEQHSPTSFEVTFRYKLLPSECDPECNCEGVEKGTILLRLPDEVEVNAQELMICDPVEGKH